MPAIRTYKCNHGHSFEHYHASMDEPLLDFCPVCVEAEKVTVIPGGGHIGGSARSKAEKMAFDMAQSQGLTDMKDSTREGESIFKPPPAPQGDARALQDHIDLAMKTLTHQTPEQAKAANQFWSAGASTPQQAATAQQSLMGLAAGASAQARAAGQDPMALFHNTMKKHPEVQAKVRIIAK